MAEVDASGATVNAIGGMGGGFGAAFAGIASIAMGAYKNQEAKAQAKRAEELRKKSDAVQTMGLRSEYLKTLKMQEMAALAGLPGYNQYLNNIDSSVASNARAIRESSPSGADTLNTISAVLGSANDAKNNLFVQDAANRENKMAQVAQTMWNTGDKQMDLVGLQRADKNALNQGAMNLENSATANRVGSTDQILSTVGALGATAGKLIDGGAGKTDGTASDGSITMADGTKISAETIQAILALQKKNGGNIVPDNFTFKP